MTFVNPFPPNYLPPNRVGLVRESDRYEEDLADQIISVGHLIMKLSTNNLQPHNVRGGLCEKLFALEQGYQGAVGGQVSKKLWDDYAIGDLVSYVIARSGDVLYVRAALGELITEGDLLSSNGDGTLFSTNGTTTSTTSTTPPPVVFYPIAVSLDTLNLKTTTTSTTLASGQTNSSDAPGNMIRVRIL